MIPATSKRFRVSQLVGGSDYDLCVLALCARAGAPSASTRALGCVRFSTPAPVRSGADDADCSGALTGAHAGGTVVLVIAALIVASLLAFIGVYVARNRGALGRAARADGCGRWCPSALEARDSCCCCRRREPGGRSRDAAKNNGGMARFPNGGGGAAQGSPTASYDRRPLRHDRRHRRADEAPAYESADFFGGTRTCSASSVSSRGSLGSSDGRSSVTPDSVSLSGAGQAGNGATTAAAAAASRSGSIATAGATCDCGVRSEIDRLLGNAFFSPASPPPLGGTRPVSASDDGDRSTVDSRQSSLVPGSERAPLLGAASYSAGATASSTPSSAPSHAGQRLARLLGLQSAAPPAGAVAVPPAAAGEFPRGRAKRSQSFEARGRKRKSDPGDLTGGGTLPRNADGAKMAARRSLCLSSEWVMESTV